MAQRVRASAATDPCGGGVLPEPASGTQPPGQEEPEPSTARRVVGGPRGAAAVVVTAVVARLAAVAPQAEEPHQPQDE